MEYRYLGNTGLKVSELCYGTMSFGGDADRKTSAELFKSCRDAGINCFDCANVYSGGEAERILGKLMAGSRDELVITTKTCMPMGEGPNERGLSRYRIVRSVEESLKRLNTDRIDILFFHAFDPPTPLEESLRAVDDLVSSGKVTYLGISNFAAWQIAKANGLADLHGWTRVSCLQPMYNLAKRQAEVEILPMAQSEGMGVLSYSPLGGGLLTGKYKGPAPTDEKPDGTGRLSQNRMYAIRYRDESGFAAAAGLKEIADELGVAPASLAVRWVSTHPGVTAPIIGARNVGQLADSLKSVSIKMDEQLRSRISALSPTPPPPTDRSEEQSRSRNGT